MAFLWTETNWWLKTPKKDEGNIQLCLPKKLDQYIIMPAGRTRVIPSGQDRSTILLNFKKIRFMQIELESNLF